MRRQRRRPEDAIQRAVFQHLAARPAAGLFAFHVPNGGKRSPIEAGILKGLGVVAGVPDVLAIKAGHLYALELKAPGGLPTAAQRACHEALTAAGATVGVAIGLDAALAWLESHGLLRGKAALASSHGLPNGCAARAAIS